MTIDPETIAFAHKLADVAGEVIRPYFRKRIDVTDKHAGQGRFDPVTIADKGAEQAVRAVIERERPDDGILGEEFGEKPSRNGYCWTLDPVDGTRAFITGRHEWGSLIALEKDGRAVLGIIDQPVLGERFIGVNSEAELRTHSTRQRIRVQPCEDLSQAVLCATHPYAYFTDDQQQAFRRVADATRMTRFNGDCYIFALLALGFVDLVIESTLHRWDVAALIPIVEGAGGIITDWNGNRCDDGGQVLAASDPRIHAQAMKLLAG